MTWLRIESEPPRQFYKDPSDIQHLNADEARHGIIESIGSLRAGVEGETPNISITMRNSSAESSRLFLSPPLGAKAELLDSSGAIFSGIVYRVELGDTCTVTIEA